MDKAIASLWLVKITTLKLDVATASGAEIGRVASVSGLMFRFNPNAVNLNIIGASISKRNQLNRVLVKAH